MPTAGVCANPVKVKVNRINPKAKRPTTTGFWMFASCFHMSLLFWTFRGGPIVAAPEPITCVIISRYAKVM
jgi:hypothetical protein